MQECSASATMLQPHKCLLACCAFRASQMNAEGILSMDRLEEQRQRRARGVRMEDYDAGGC